LGITVPVNGQLWYNTDSRILYTYDLVDDTWRTSSGLSIDSEPAFPVTADLKYDSTYHLLPTAPQLTVYNGSAFVSVAHEYVELKGEDGARGSAMTGLLTLSGDPTDPLHPVTKQYGEAIYLDILGTNAMTGDLDMGTKLITNVGNPTTDDHVGDRGYNDDRYLERDGTNPMAGTLNMGTNTITEVVDPD